jgi:transcriptional regulator with XRE-family HTH domain
MEDTAVASNQTVSEALEEEGASDRIASYIRTALGNRDMKQTELALRTGINAYQLTRRLKGIHRWKPVELFAVADELQVPVEDILSNVPAPPWRFEET